MASSILSFSCNNPVQAGSNAGHLLAQDSPAVSASTTGWICGKIAAGNWSRLTYNTEKAAATFTTTAEPSGTPLNSAEDCFRSDATTGDFSAGTWYSAISCIAVSNGGAMDGRAIFKLYRSTNADGTSPTAITSNMTGSLVTNLATSAAQQSSASTQVGAFSLNNEYLFMQVAWEITGAGGNNAADCLIRYGGTFPVALNLMSGLVTSAFSATLEASTAAPSPYYANYYQRLVA